MIIWRREQIDPKTVRYTLLGIWRKPVKLAPNVPQYLFSATRKLDWSLRHIPADVTKTIHPQIDIARASFLGVDAFIVSADSEKLLREEPDFEVISGSVIMTPERPNA